MIKVISLEEYRAQRQTAGATTTTTPERPRVIRMPFPVYYGKPRGKVFTPKQWERAWQRAENQAA